MLVVDTECEGIRFRQLGGASCSIFAVISCDELRPSPDFAGLAAYIVTRSTEPHVVGQPRLDQMVDHTNPQ